MRAAVLDPTGVVVNLIEVAPREVPAGAVVVPAGVQVTVGWRHLNGSWIDPAVSVTDPPPVRDLDAEFAAKADKTTTLAGLRAVVRDYLIERSAAN